MSKRTLLIAIPIVAIVLNGVGYLIVSKVRTPTRPAASDLNAGRPPVGGTANRDAAKTPGSDSPAPQDPKAVEERAMARRATGLTALEAGDYQKALINFTEAKALLGDKAQVDELLRVTDDLRTRPTKSRTSAAGSAPSPAPSKSNSRGASRRIAVREEAPAEAIPPSSAPPAASVPSGLLIVSTTPRGMLVQVDEVNVDLTPLRTKVKPG
jgi:hypothetical protein